MARTKRTAGQALRARILREVEPDDAVGEILLAAVCAEADLIERLERSIADEGVTIQGARGQQVAHPALAALARHRRLFVELAKQLQVGPVSATSLQASAAAKQRWRREKGA